MVQKHFQEREALVQKAAKAAEFNKRKIASHLAKMVKSFWNNVEKVRGDENFRWYFQFITESYLRISRESVCRF